MADGSHKPIKDVHPGDKVMATDPVTGKSQARIVLGVNVKLDQAFTDLAVKGPDGKKAVIHTTQHHQIWDQTRRMWTHAGDLTAKARLLVAGGRAGSVVSTTNFAGAHNMWDLTVDKTHTFYVFAGETPVLVHNCPRKLPGRVLEPGQANDLAKWLGYAPTNQISAGGSRVWKAGNGVKGPKFIAEDLTGHLGGIFKGGNKSSDLMSTGKVARQGTYDLGAVGNNQFDLIKIGD
jgi:hypothetical protein